MYYVVEPGNDNQSFNGPLGIACDTQGRIYVADSNNNRVQIYSPEGKHLKTIPADRPKLVQVHRKTGAIYVLHLGRYGNFDSGNGPKSKHPSGGDNITLFQPRFISGTDDYLVFSDWGERLVVLNLNYHAEERAGLVGQ